MWRKNKNMRELYGKCQNLRSYAKRKCDYAETCGIMRKNDESMILLSQEKICGRLLPKMGKICGYYAGKCEKMQKMRGNAIVRKYAVLSGKKCGPQNSPLVWQKSILQNTDWKKTHPPGGVAFYLWWWLLEPSSCKVSSNTSGFVPRVYKTRVNKRGLTNPLHLTFLGTWDSWSWVGAQNIVSLFWGGNAFGFDQGGRRNSGNESLLAFFGHKIKNTDMPLFIETS